MGIKIIKPGLFTTVQDEGRMDYLSHGVPRSGAMDQASMYVANLALANPRSAAVLEFTYAQAEIEVEADILVAYAGYGGVLICKEQKLPKNRPLLLKKGMRLTFRPSNSGCRTYLSICGGWDVPLVMGSRSTYQPAQIGGLEGRLIQQNDVLRAKCLLPLQQNLMHNLSENNRLYTSWYIPPIYPDPQATQPIRVMQGPEAGWFSKESWLAWLRHPYSLDRKSNRMGYTLSGQSMPRLDNHPEMLSSAVCQGTIQITGSGIPILLMADCQTTGGYPRLAQVAAVDLPRCAQLKPGDTIHFQEISVAEAEKLYLKREVKYAQLAESIFYKYDQA